LVVGKTMNKIKILCIDPGVKTGIAIIEGTNLKPEKILEVDTTDFWGCYDKYNSSLPLKSPFDKIVIENPGFKKLTFGKRDKNQRVQDTKSQNVGQVIREADLLAEGFEREGFNVARISPNKSYCKKSKEYVLRLTGFEGRTNEHNRDALMMGWVNWLRIINS